MGIISKNLCLILICILIIQFSAPMLQVHSADPLFPLQPSRTVFNENFEYGAFWSAIANFYWLKPVAGSAQINIVKERTNNFLQYQYNTTASADDVVAAYKLPEAYRPEIYGSTKSVFSVDFRIDSVTPDDAYVGLKLRRYAVDGSVKADGIEIGIAKEGIKYVSPALGTVSVPNSSVEKGIWNRLALVVYPNSGSYDIYLNNVYCATVNGWLSTDFAGLVSQICIDKFGALTPISKKFDFDNFAIYDLSANPETAYTGSIAGPYTAAENNTATENFYNNTLPLAAAVNASTPLIKVQWRKDTKGLATSYSVYKRLKGATDWGSAIATSISPTNTSYTDSNITIGTSYEYRVDMIKSSGSVTNYISSGVKVPIVENKGTVILLIDNTIKDAIYIETEQLTEDLIGEGWKVEKLYASRTESVDAIRSSIKTIYDADSVNVNTLFIIGHVPIKYYGSLNPDGHEKRPFPCDQFYGDMTGEAWPDSTGSKIPRDIQLKVGRVDFFDMPTFAADEKNKLTEVGLLKRYLDKNHRYRTGQIEVESKSIWDRTGSFPDSGALPARSFSQLTGIDSIDISTAFAPSGTYFKKYSSKRPYLWGHKAGWGTYASAGVNELTASDYTSDVERKCMFLSLYGSYFCEWDRKDNVMRASLTGENYGLGAFWLSGSGSIDMYELGMGETIGKIIRTKQNASDDIYFQLMGDPTLIMYPFKSVGSATVVKGSNNTISWDAVTGADGYYLYMANDTGSPFMRRVAEPITTVSYVDSESAPSTAVYMVRPYRIETTPSGSYYNLATGVVAKEEISAEPPSVSGRQYLFFENLNSRGKSTAITSWEYEPPYNTDAWSINYYGGKANYQARSVRKPDGAVGDNALMIDFTGADASKSLTLHKKFTAQTGIFSAELDYYFDKSNTRPLDIKIGVGKGVDIATVRVSNTQLEIVKSSSDTGNLIMPAPAKLPSVKNSVNKWQNIKIQIDYQSKQYTVFLNGTQIWTSVFRTQKLLSTEYPNSLYDGAAYLSLGSMAGHGTGRVYIDNLSVYRDN